MMTSQKRTEILSDLLRINKDCTRSLQLYIKDHPCSSRLVPLLQRLVNVERACLLELRKNVDTSYGDPANAVEIRGEIYDSWERTTEQTSANREKEICAFCERRIRELTRAYNKALQMTSELPEQTIKMLKQHIDRVKESFALVLKVGGESRGAERVGVYSVR
jgi:hypothetical protein